jgi:adenylylsulfate kinase
MKEAFAVWLTGLPASGKSTIARELTAALVKAGVTAEVLESDALRRVLTPDATYSPSERELFYRAVAFFGSRLVAHGIPVIFDATANRRHYRDFARDLIPRFLEVAIVTPLNVCEERDYKGTYRKGREAKTATVPGLQEPYEAPLKPEVVVDTTLLNPASATDLIMESLKKHGYLTYSMQQPQR